MSSSVHFLNVDPGECTIIRHGSGRTSMIDICSGNLEGIDDASAEPPLLADPISVNEASFASQPQMTGGDEDYNMRFRLTNPIKYAESIGVSNIFRFILSRPDPAHMDGLKALAQRIGVSNFWDTGLKLDKPKVENTVYREEDWEQYKKLSAGEETTIIQHRAGGRFKVANLEEDNSPGGDALYILAPTKELMAGVLQGDDRRNASYVILYRGSGGRILLSGDAHDATWHYVLSKYRTEMAHCSVMIAPCHGQDSDKLHEFLDQIQPKLTLFGNAVPKTGGYDAWKSRKLPFITSNQAGNIVLEVKDETIDVYVENDSFAATQGKDCTIRNAQNYVLFQTIEETPEGDEPIAPPGADSAATPKKSGFRYS